MDSLSNQSSVHLIEIFNNRNWPNTIYISVRVRLIEVSAESGFVVKGLQDINFGTRLSVRLIEPGFPLNWGPLKRRFRLDSKALCTRGNLVTLIAVIEVISGLIRKRGERVN